MTSGEISKNIDHTKSPLKTAYFYRAETLTGHDFKDKVNCVNSQQLKGMCLQNPGHQEGKRDQKPSGLFKYTTTHTA